MEWMKSNGVGKRDERMVGGKLAIYRLYYNLQNLRILLEKLAPIS